MAAKASQSYPFSIDEGNMDVVKRIPILAGDIATPSRPHAKTCF